MTMLIGSRTKQVNAYGKRKQRIVNVKESDDLGSIGSVGTGSLGKGVIHKMKPRSAPSATKTGEENVVVVKRKPKLKTKETEVTRVAKVQQQYRELRIPLSPLPAVRLDVLPRPRPHSTPVQKNKKIVDVDIKVFDDNGHVVSSQKKKTSPSSSSTSAELTVTPRRLQGGRRKMNKLIVLSDDEEELESPADVPVIHKPKPSRKTVIDLSSPPHSPELKHSNVVDLTSPEQTYVHDFEDPIPSPPHVPSIAKRKSRPHNIHKLSPPAAKVLTLQEFRSLPSIPTKQPRHSKLASPPRPKGTSSFSQQPRRQHISSPIVRRTIQLFPSSNRAGTPIRSSTLRLAFSNGIRQDDSENEEDLDDLEDELDVLAGRLSLEASSGLASISKIPLSESLTSSPPTSPLAHELPDERLQPLLKECRQSTVLDFTQFVADQLSRSPKGENVFRKIGEASYSEVFGIGNIVLKVVPVLLPGSALPSEDDESPAPTPVEDVVKELQVTRAMGEIPGFVNMVKACVVKGVYPEVFMQCWDEFDEEKGSESVRPDTFTRDQIYTVIVLPFAGTPLEVFRLRKWTEAYDIFCQVANALKEAEQRLGFEHRDMHWGQILVSSTCTGTKRHAAEELKVTLIDFGLSRMDSMEGDTWWTAFEDEVFEGEGEYQFDVYRMMREHIEGRKGWEVFEPRTNIMWLHYLLRKLIKNKGLRAPPPISNTSSTSASRERNAYELVLGLEDRLGSSLHDLTAYPYRPKTKTKSRRKTVLVETAASKLTCAGDVLGIYPAI